jgi:hypothetical protein
MPALQLFGRAWRFGSDDFTFPGIAGVLLRGSWYVFVNVMHTLPRYSFANENNVL